MTKVLIMAWFGGTLGWAYAQLRDSEYASSLSRREKIFWVSVSPLWPVLMLAWAVVDVVLWSCRRRRGRS